MYQYGYGLLLCGFNVAIKGLIVNDVHAIGLMEK